MTRERESSPSFLAVGRILTTFGIAGALKVEPFTDDPERFKELTQVELELPGGERKQVRVSRVQVRERDVLLTFRGYSVLEEAAKLRGAVILIPASEAVALPEGRYFHHQILGLRVVTKEGEDLGVVTEILEAPAHEVYVTGKTMIPALRSVVKAINLDAKEMVVDLPPTQRAEAAE